MKKNKPEASRIKSAGRFWRDLPIGSKMRFVMLFTLLVIFASNLILYSQINYLIRRMNSVYSSNVNLSELSDSIDRVQEDLYRYLEVRDYESLSDFFREEENYRRLYQSLSEQVGDNPSLVLEKNIRNMSANFLKYADDAVSAKRGMNVSAYRENYEKAEKLYRFIVDDIEDLNEIQFQNNAANYQTLQKALQYMEFTSILTQAVVVLVSILLVIAITRDIVAPLRDLAHTASRIGEGNLDLQVAPVDSNDEIGIVTRTFNDMVTSIKSYVVQVRESAEKQQEMKEQELMMQNHLKEAQLRFLQAQINPHFLYNSLNAGVQLAEMEDDEKTAVFLEKMADFFRYNVRKGKEDATIAQELEMVDNYIYILNVRFAGEIYFEKQVNPRLLDCSVPGMILQPIVENAVNHGIRDMLGEGKIFLTIDQKDNKIAITVADNGKGMTSEQIATVLAHSKVAHDDESTGVGLDNVISRLVIYFDVQPEEMVAIESEGPGKGTAVTLYLPIRRMD
ncbi:MAG: histidine kinase [Lachnospiraceae bacterium]|nr:histidine kinase [Lachnospiraceae bacterium]